MDSGWFVAECVCEPPQDTSSEYGPQFCPVGCFTYTSQTRRTICRLSKAEAMQNNQHCCSKRYQWYTSDGTPLSFATPRSGEHHDSFEIEEVLREIFALLGEADIDVQGIFLNADAAFDTTVVRSVLAEFGIEANIPMNPRNATAQERDEYFDDELYTKRTVIEHTFAWLDGFKGLLLRYETKLKNWTAMNVIGFIVIFIRRILNSQKC